MRVGQSSTRKTTRCGAGPGRRGKPEAEGRNPTRNGPPSRGPGSSEDGPGAVDRRLRPLEQVRAEVDTISWSPDTSGKRFPHAEIRGRPDSDRAFSAMGSSCDSPAVHAVFDKTTKHCPPPGFQLPDAGFLGARASRPHRHMAGLRPACGRDARVPRRPKVHDVRAGETPALPQCMDSRFRGNDVISARRIAFRLAVIPAEAGIHRLIQAF